jgi:two-component sensor histidine kinase
MAGNAGDDTVQGFDAQHLIEAFAAATEHAVLVACRSGKILAASEEAVRLFEIDAQDLLGRNLKILEIDDNAPDVERRLASVGGNLRLDEATTCVTASGTRVAARVMLSLVGEGISAPAAIVVAYRRVATDMRVADALDALLEHIPEGITIADAPDVTIRRVSRHGLELMQRAEDAVTGIGADKHPKAWQVFDADGVRQLAADELPLTRAVERGEIVRNETVSLRKPDGSFVPILCNAGPIVAPSGEITGGLIAWRDVSDLREAEKQRTLLLREMHHRVKNAFALASSLVGLIGRRSTSVSEVVSKLHDRINALARAQELVRFELETSRHQTSTTLYVLAAAVLAPFMPDQDEMVTLSGPDVVVDGRMVASLALILSELATNAVKHGALSLPDGSVSVTWTLVSEGIAVEWVEFAPGLSINAPSTGGFGSRLIESSVSSLGGDVRMDWRSTGLALRLVLPGIFGSRTC